MNANQPKWESDLETALRQNCSKATINKICKGRAIPYFFRAEIWQICLGVQDKGTQLLQCNKTFGLGLPEQNTLSEQNDLRNDCQSFLSDRSYGDEDKVTVVSDLESILKYYSKSNNAQYKKGNGWLEILSTLLELKLHRVDTYNLFQAITKKYIPTINVNNKTPFHLFRLILLYHDPELCSFLDTKQISPESYCCTWFQTLFAANCSLVVLFKIWDFYLMESEPFLIFFLALVLIFTAKEKIIAMKSESIKTIIDMMKTLPEGLTSNDISDFCSLAQYYANSTPLTYKTELSDVLFHPTMINDAYAHMLCLPVGIEELQKSNLRNYNKEKHIRLFLIDCRPEEQYNAGHLPTAYHLDSNVMLQKPDVFEKAVQELLTARRQVVYERRHLCFLGSGNNPHDQHLNMVVATFLHKQTQYVSILAGGYQSIHQHFIRDISSSIIDHREQTCLICSTKAQSVPIDTSKQTVCTSKEVIKKLGKLTLDFISLNIIDSVDNCNQTKQIRSLDKQREPYRNTGTSQIFSIDEDVEEQESETMQKYEKQEVISTSELLKSSKASFKCHDVTSYFMHPVTIVLMASNMLVLRDAVGEDDVSLISVQRSYSTIKKMTCRKKQPQLISIEYRLAGDGSLIERHRFLMRNESEATSLVRCIVKQMKC